MRVEYPTLFLANCYSLFICAAILLWPVAPAAAILVMAVMALMTLSMIIVVSMVMIVSLALMLMIMMMFVVLVAAVLVVFPGIRVAAGFARHQVHAACTCP